MLLVEVVLLCMIFALSLRFSSLYFSIGTLLLTACYLSAVIATFLYAHTILHVVRPTFMIVFAFISILIYRYVHEEREKIEGLRQRDFIRATFGRYLSKEVVDELLSSPDGLKMSGELREVTFLVSDLRNFTPLASRLSPDRVIAILNRYFERMVEIIAVHRGTIDEFQGDGILVFFGAPLRSEDDPERAVRCAIDMQKKMSEINRELEDQGLPELHMGIGIHTGEVVVGNIGSEKRSKYGAVGDAINVAYRIESQTNGGQILISASTYEKVRDIAHAKETLKANLKGIENTVTLYEIRDIYKPFGIEI
jgi:class 3 adenylate cyclase